MKDPLQTSETPYEVLGIEPGLSDERLRNVYFEAIRRGVPAAQATEAYNVLRRPVERAKIALTPYDPHALEQLNPCPLHDEAALHIGHRAATARAWEDRLKETIPEAGTIHRLVVLWYWWTQHEEQRCSLILDAVRDPQSLARGRTGKHSLLRSIARGNGYNCHPDNRLKCPHADCSWRADCRSPATSLERMWQEVVAYWCTLAVTVDFWTGIGGLTPAQIKELSESFLDSLHSQMLDRSQEYAARLHPDGEDSSDTGIHWGWGGMTQAMQKQEWSEAVRLLREAMEKVGTDVPNELKKVLAVCLTNDAVAKIARVQTNMIVMAAISSRDQEIDASFSSAAEELYEALYWDPSGELPRQKLESLRSLASKLNIGLPSQRKWRPPKLATKPSVAAPADEVDRTTPGSQEAAGSTAVMPKGAAVRHTSDMKHTVSSLIVLAYIGGALG